MRPVTIAAFEAREGMILETGLRLGAITRTVTEDGVESFDVPFVSERGWTIGVLTAKADTLISGVLI
jgi:hypothetical protein